MSRLVLTQITIKKERSISSTTWYYLLQPANASTPDSTNYGNPPPTYSDTGYSGWSTTEPTYTVGDNRVLYVMVQTLYSDGTFSYSTPTISSSYEAAKDAYNEVIQAEATISEFEELGLKRGYVWDNMTYVAPSGSIPAYPVGTYVASGILVNGQRSITRSNSNTYGLNTWISTGGINLRYNAIDLMKLTTSNLEFYYPSTSSQQKKAISLGTNGAVNSLAFYGFNSDKKTMELTNDGLHFYNPSNGTTELASFTTNGLILSKGGIRVNTVGYNNGVYISSENLGSVISSLVPTPSGGTDKTNWRAIIGSKFGVDSEGNLYANEAHISGVVNALSGTIGGWNIGTDTNKSLYTGNFGEDGGIYISPSYTGILTISGEENQNWAFTAGNAFGVTTDGKLYATGVEIAGGTLSELLTAVSGGYHAFVTSASGDASEDIDVIIDEELFLEQIEPIVEAAVSSDQSAPIVGQYYFSKSGSVWSLENSIIERRTVDLASFGIIVEDNTITQFYVIVESVMGLAEESAQLQENFSRIEEQKDIIENNLSTLTTDIDDIQNKQTTTDNTLNSVNNRLGVAENNINIMGPVVEKINKRISINPEVPSITIQASDGTETKSVVITDDQVQFKSGSSIQAYAGGENFVAPSLQTTQILMRTKVSGTLTGGLGFIMRSNGHLSIKRITGGE